MKDFSPEKNIFYEKFHEVTDSQAYGPMAGRIIECINNAFGHEMPEDEVAEALLGSFIVVAQLGDKGEKVVGFSSLHQKNITEGRYPELVNKYGDVPYFSLGAGTVDQDYQGNGIYRELNRARVQFIVENRAPIITTTTQNPRVEKGFSAVLSEYVSEGLLLGYEVQRKKLPEFYGRRLTKDDVHTKDTPFEELDIDAGDAFSLLFTLEYPEK